MSRKKCKKPKKPRNLIARDLFTPKYRSRVVESKKNYKRSRDKAGPRDDGLSCFQAAPMDDINPYNKIVSWMYTN